MSQITAMKNVRNIVTMPVKQPPPLKRLALAVPIALAATTTTAANAPNGADADSYTKMPQVQVMSRDGQDIVVIQLPKENGVQQETDKQTSNTATSQDFNVHERVTNTEEFKKLDAIEKLFKILDEFKKMAYTAVAAMILTLGFFVGLEHERRRGQR